MTPSLSSTESPDGSSSRDCTVCSQPIPLARLAALPLTTKCVQCVIDGGDPRIHRFDDYHGTEAEHCEQVFFYPGDRYIEKALRKLNGFFSRGSEYGAEEHAGVNKRTFCSVSTPDHTGSYEPYLRNDFLFTHNIQPITYDGPAAMVQPFEEKESNEQSEDEIIAA